jgi:hypothetical protein
MIILLKILNSCFPAKIFSKNVSKKEKGIIASATYKNILGKPIPNILGSSIFKPKTNAIDKKLNPKPCQTALLYTTFSDS